MRQLIVFVLMASSMALCEVNYALDLRARINPTVVNLFATAAYDRLMWGEKNNEVPAYGYLRVGARGGGSPNYGAFLQIAPIAPIIFEIQKGYTTRFLKISNFDCGRFECKGKVDRTDYSIKILAAYKRFVFMSNINWRELRTEQSDTLVVLENELFTVTPGFHRYYESALTAGYKLADDSVVGVLSSVGVLSEGDRQTSSLYAIYRFIWEDINIVTGLGSYKSDQPNQDGFGAIFSLNYQWGEKLSLL